MQVTKLENNTPNDLLYIPQLGWRKDLFHIWSRSLLLRRDAIWAEERMATSS